MFTSLLYLNLKITHHNEPNWINAKRERYAVYGISLFDDIIGTKLIALSIVYAGYLCCIRDLINILN